MVVKGFSADLLGSGSPMRGLAMSTPAPNLSALAPAPAPVPTYGIPVPVTPQQPASFSPWRVSGQLPVPQVPVGRPPGDNPGVGSNLLSLLQMGQQSRYLDAPAPAPFDPYRYLPGLFGGGENLSGAAPLSRYVLPQPQRDVPITYAPRPPKWVGFDPQAWTDY